MSAGRPSLRTASWAARRLGALTVLALAGTLLSPEAASARELLRRVGETPRFVFYAVPSGEGAAGALVLKAEADRDAIVQVLGRDWEGRTEVRVAADERGFRELLPPEARVPRWAQGVAFPRENLVVLRVPATLENPRALLRHELSHVAVGRLAPRPVPRWFLEGLATVQAGDLWNRQGPSLVRAALSDGLFSFAQLADGFPSRESDAELAYAQSADFVQFLIDRGGDERLGGLLRQLVEGETFEDAALRTFGRSLRALENDWRRSIARWELLARFLTGTELWWGTVAVLAVIGFVRLRRRQRERLEELAREEQEEDALVAEERALEAEKLRVVRFEAEPRWDGAAPPEATEPAEAEGEDSLAEAPGRPDERPPRKPTLH